VAHDLTRLTALIAVRGHRDLRAGVGLRGRGAVRAVVDRRLRCVCAPGVDIRTARRDLAGWAGPAWRSLIAVRGAFAHRDLMSAPETAINVRADGSACFWRAFVVVETVYSRALPGPRPHAHSVLIAM